VLTHCWVQDPCSDFGELQFFYRYDPLTDQWTSLPKPPSCDHILGMAGVINKKLYVVGGSGGCSENALDVYDPATNQWTSKTPPPSNRVAAAGLALGGKLYVIGGYREGVNGTWAAVRTTSVYNPATDTWTNLAPLPTARADISGSRVFVNGHPRIEVVGGVRPGNNLQYIP
jgi:N-acetylneuraminic acid mutarotase